MMEVTTVKLPTHFEELEPLEKDSRFQKVKIYIAHTGENLNNSVFSHEVFEKMMPSLAHIPILGYVGANESGESDFRGHEKKLTIDDKGFKVSFETHAYGFVPEDNDAHFEVTGGKEWLVTNGYLWTRFVDAMELFKDSNGTKGQSMEIGNADGYTDDRGRMVFTNATFTGLCILGDDVPPAMTGSTVSTVFSRQDFKSTFEEMLAEFTAEKGEKALATKKKQKDEAAIVTKEEKPGSSDSVKSETPTKSDSSASTAASSTAKPATSSATSSASKSAEKPASKEDKVESAQPAASTATSEESSAPVEDKAAAPSNEVTDNQESSDDNDEAEMSVKNDVSLNKNESAYENKKDKNDEDGTDEDDPEDKKKFSSSDEKTKVEFELSLSKRQHGFLEAVRAKYDTSYNWIWLEAAYEDYGIVGASQEEFSDSKYFRIAYSMNADDSIKLGDKTEVFPMYVTETEKNKIQSDRARLTDLEAQIKELTDYKKGIEMSAKQKMLEENRENLTAEQFKQIKEQFAQKSPEEIEKDIAYSMFISHKAVFAKNVQRGVKAANFNAKEDYGYGSANELFHK